MSGDDSHITEWAEFVDAEVAESGGVDRTRLDRGPVES